LPLFLVHGKFSRRPIRITASIDSEVEEELVGSGEWRGGSRQAAANRFLGAVGPTALTLPGIDSGTGLPAGIS
jgi:hypothetical protein